ncbi:MAG: hypothetical protein ACK5MN_11060 [Lachnospiraceae bacterium]
MQVIWVTALAVFFVFVNGATQLILAKRMGFRIRPVAFSYFLAAGLNLTFGSITPISGQAETISVAGLIRRLKERTTALLLSAVIMTILSTAQLLGTIVDFVGESVISGMMGGVGLILSTIAFSLIKTNKRTGIISMISALISWVLWQDVVYTIAVSVAIASLEYAFLQKKGINTDPIEGTEFIPEDNDTRIAITEKVGFIKRFKNGSIPLDEDDTSYPLHLRILSGWSGLAFNGRVLLSAAGLVCLEIGANIAFGGITAAMSGGSQNPDTLGFVNAVADFASVPFGGLPLEAIISGTGATPYPVLAGALMMILSGIVVITGLVDKIGNYIPAESIAGFLFVIGFFLTFIPNTTSVMAAEYVAPGLTALAITALSKNPFLGLVAGAFITYTGSMFGI